MRVEIITDWKVGGKRPNWVVEATNLAQMHSYSG